MRVLPRSLGLLFLVAIPAQAASGPVPTIDLGSAQRGYAVYSQVCSACHSLKQLTYGDLRGLGLDAAQVRALASGIKVSDGVDAAGHPLRRPGRPDDHLSSPFPSMQAAAAANNGAVPPDMSRLALTLPGGARAITRILTSYRDPPPGVVVPSGSYYDPAVAGALIAMPSPLVDGAVRYADGTPATVLQMAQDVSSFLDWAAHPHGNERRRIGVGVVCYLVLLAGLAFLLKRRVWSNVGRG